MAKDDAKLARKLSSVGHAATVHGKGGLTGKVSGDGGSSRPPSGGKRHGHKHGHDHGPGHPHKH